MDTREQDWASAMVAARDGDEAAYGRLLSAVATSLRPAMRTRMRHCRLSDSEAEDVVQEVLIAIHTKRRSWDPDRAFLPWLNAIARHKLIDAVRRLSRDARRRVVLADGEWDDLFEAPQSAPDAGAIDVKRHVHALSGRQREIVGALVFEGVSVREIAARLRTTEGVVRMTFHRALASLRNALDPGTEPRPRTGRMSKRDASTGQPS